MRLTRRNLRKLLLREMKVMQEGSVKNLIIEIGESIEAVMDQSGAHAIPFNNVVQMVHREYANEFPNSDDFAEFVFNNLEYMFGLNLVITRD